MLEYYITDEEGTLVNIDQPKRGCWVNVVDPTFKEIKILENILQIEPEFVRSSLDEEESSHLDFDEDSKQVLVIADYPVEDKDDSFEQDGVPSYSTSPVGIIIKKEFIVTICREDSELIEWLLSGKLRHLVTQLKTRFLLQILLHMSQQYLSYLRKIEKFSDNTEKRLYRSMKNRELLHMLELQKSLVYFSTSLKADEMTLHKIQRGRYITLFEDDQDILEDVMIELKQAIEMCQIYQNILSSTMDGFSNVINNNMNVIMKKLTVITLVMSIPNMVYGFYGMNVSGLVLPHAWFPLVISIIACIICWWYFRQNKRYK